MASGSLLNIGLPHFPGRAAAGVQAFQLLLIFESVHARPEAVVWIANQLLLCHQPVEGLNHQLFFVPHVLENLLS